MDLKRNTQGNPEKHRKMRLAVPKAAYNEIEASEYLGLSRSALRRMRRRNQLGDLPYVKLGVRTVRYLKSDLDAWLSQILMHG
jgi:excisionase family DNA binding protein